MTVEIGHFALAMALPLALLQIALAGSGSLLAHRNRWIDAACAASLAVSALLAIAFMALMLAFLRSDFSVATVVANSHSAKPLLYKISGVWGNHEGSMLLWVLVMALYASAVAISGRNMPVNLQGKVLAVLAALEAAFLAYLLFSSNPFARLDLPPFQGADLNPLLQDPGLAFHPPLLYLGYVGLSVPFAFAVAALLGGGSDAAWARYVRPWTLASWMFLTLGIALGSWWAYYELGWGGWWFWDPVENASFMPWLVATALLHSAIVVERRESLKSWTVFLAILAFSLVLAGTFLVRSGLLTSVHAFASDPQRGVSILSIMALFCGGALLIFALRARRLAASGPFSPISRETALIANNLLLLVAAGVVFIGTFWPLIAEMLFDRILTVGPPFFDLAFTPFMIALALLLPIGALLPWKRAALHHAIRKLRWPAVLALAVGLAILLWSGSLVAAIGIAIANWLVAGAVVDIVGRPAARSAMLRIARIRPSGWGKCLAHAGLGITIAGISAVTAWEIEDIRLAAPGDRYRVAGYEISFRSLGLREGPNYSSVEAVFDLQKNGRNVAILRPERRLYPVSGTRTTEAGIDIGLMRDLYAVIGDPHAEGNVTVRFFVKPLVNWIWAGAAMMALGAALSLADRRLRVGAGAPRRSSISMKTA